MDTTPLKGRVALVTGAARNIGRAIALALADAGAKVAVNVRTSRAEGQAVVDEIAAHGGDALLVAADVTQRADVDAMIAAIAKRFGRLDIVVNNAAIRHEAAFAGLPYAEIAQILGGTSEAARRAAADGIKNLRKNYPGGVPS